MATYRIYCLDQADRITDRHDLDADSDAAVLAMAHARFVGCKVEIWELGRLIGRANLRLAA